ncbi:MAG TPA: transcriptional repressor LexA [Kofleriaceae bacterium]|nr:transcriptional repressor LexA [Kofleriaceae bacterium]
MPDHLTQRQRDILDFIAASIDQRGYPPTLREIGEHFGIRSTNGVSDHLKALEKKGFLAREDLKSRAMRPVSSVRAVLPDIGGLGGATRLGQELCHVPLIGRVAAGQPLLAVENVEDTVVVDRFFIGSTREVFALRVVGESMIEDGIFDGDYVFVRKTPTAGRGEIVVAMIEGEATVKRFYPEGDVIRFQPANAAMQPILVRQSEFRSVDILGVVVGVYRQLGRPEPVAARARS